MLSDEESAELAELRRRAWGESPDILGDEPALARLQELEDKARLEVAQPSPRVERPPSLDRSPSQDPPPSPDRSPSPDPPPSQDPPEEPVVERASPPRGEKRGVLVIGGVIVIVVALAAAVSSILIPSPESAASPSPRVPLATPRTLPAPECGDGWGVTGTLSTPAGKPVWSRQFDFPISETWLIPVEGARRVGVWANLDVSPGTISDVEVVSPTTARLFYTGVKTWTEPPSPDEIISNSKSSIVLPVCGNPDSYPGFILARAPACVTLEFTIAGTTHYTVRTPVGLDEGAHCPTQ